MCVSFPKKTIKDFVEGFGFTFFTINMVDTDLGSIPSGKCIFCTFLQKYTGDLRGDAVDSMIYAEGGLCFTG